MDDNVNRTNDSAERARTEKTLRTVWFILIAVFALVIAFNLYRWTQGRGDLRGMLSPFGFILLGTATIVRPRSVVLANILMVAAAIIVFTGLILMIIY